MGGVSVSIHWRDELSVDGGAIDTDHKFLIALINEFDAEFDKGFDQYRILDALKRLEYYTVYHFSREEAIQQSLGFSNIREHAEQHRQLRINVKGAIGLMSQNISKANQAAVKSRIAKLLRLWIVAHIANFDMEMKPFFRKRGNVQPIKHISASKQDGSEGYSIPFSETGKSMAVQVVATDQFVGISFRGRATMNDSSIMAKACEIINSASVNIIVANLGELRDFDEYFIGHLLSLFGTFNEGNRSTYLVTGSEGACVEKIRKMGVDQIVRCFPSTSDFYHEVGFKT